MFRHQILVQNASKKPEKSISDHIMKIKATKTTLSENQKIFKNLKKIDQKTQVLILEIDKIHQFLRFS